MRHATDAAEAVGSIAALIGIPALTWAGFVGLIEAATQLLGLL
jgi:hypothetical protein